MITAMLIIAATMVSPADKPFAVTWKMKWSAPYKATVHTRRFDTAIEAVQFSGRARMCETNQVPCVEWVSAYVIKYDISIMEARLK